MTQTSKKFEENTESGIALLIAIFVLLLITAIGAGMIMLTNTEISTSSNFRDEQTAFFSAKAGFEEDRDLEDLDNRRLSFATAGSTTPSVTELR